MSTESPAAAEGERTLETRRRRLIRIFRVVMILTVLAFIAVGAVGAEMWARNYERTRETQPDYFPSIYYPHRRLRYGLVPNMDYYGWFKINSLGFRGREVTMAKPPGVFRIICFGGSTTFDIGAIRPNKPWPEVLEDQLRTRLGTDAIEVLNFGIGGATSLDSLIDLQMRGLLYDPDIVIVYQGHNDLVYSIPSSSPVPPSPLFPLEDRPRSAFVRWLTNKSLLYAKTQGRINDRIDSVMSVVKKVVTVGTADEGVIQDRDEAMEKGFVDYRHNINSIAAIARTNKIPLILPKVLVPFPGEAPCRQCDSLSDLYGGVAVEKLRAMFGRYNEVLERAGGEGVHFIQTEGFVPNADKYYNDPVHFGPEGSRQMGIHLAETLAPMIKPHAGS
jgi:lysophospholipase L1-like esterase